MILGGGFGSTYDVPMMREDTIAAVATPAGEGGIGIVRISGAEAFAIADQSEALLFAALARVTKRRVGEFNSWDLASMAWAFVTAD